MSGGDLDGDRYWVCWDLDFIKAVPKQNIGSPTEYSTNLEKNKKLILPNEMETIVEIELEGKKYKVSSRTKNYLFPPEGLSIYDYGISPNTLRDMKNLFLLYNPTLGHATYIHMELADRLEKGVRDPLTKKYGKLCNDMLEDPLLSIDSEVLIDEYKKKYYGQLKPDFMILRNLMERYFRINQFNENWKAMIERPAMHTYYKSEKLLGVLCRIGLDELYETMKEIPYNGPIYTLLPTCVDELDDHFHISKKDYPEYKTQIEMVRKARFFRGQYLAELKYVMFNYSNKKDSKNSILWNKETLKFEDPREKALEGVRNKCRLRFEEEYKTQTERMEAASIWYYVCYGGRLHPLKVPESPAFAWIVFDYLISYMDKNSFNYHMIKVSPNYLERLKLKRKKPEVNFDSEEE